MGSTLKGGDSPEFGSSIIQDVWSCDTLEKAEAFIASPRHASSSNESGQYKIRMQNYVAGSFAAPPSPSMNSETSQSIDAVNPKTGRTFGQVPISSADEVEHVLRAATDAFGAWSTTPAAVRSKHLQRVAQLIQDHRELFAVWESIDQGKTLERARVEVDRAVSNFKSESCYFSTFILHQQTTARVVDGSNILTYEHRSPTGVFALTRPGTCLLAPCLAFGCTAVAKPSEVTSMTAFLLCEVFRRAGLPAGVMNVVFGDGATTGSALVRSPLVRGGVSFTGGTATGIQIRRDTADQIYKHLSLELGGKNPTLVFGDVELDKAVQTAAMAAFENQGEICLCGSRIYVQSSIYDDFVAAFTAYVQANYKCGERVGAVVSHQHYTKIRSYLQLAQSEGATFFSTSTSSGTPEFIPPADPTDGYWIAPVILTDVPPRSRLLQDEIFGPVATVSRFSTEDEAVALANDNPNGLAAVLLTRDGARMRRVGERLEAGLVWVNCWLVRELGTPFGGMKSSGTGREGGEYSRDVFTHARTLHMPLQ
ncbi:aldehyde dehydrogenase family 8 member A1 [Apiospora phragmitis]|uniref:Aldehyde dehydrogenase family 8 member A1 n=1 Tax=Apiospora phragmitis TaxID=2905665 RepID=A0ABR1URD9_9PEZI